MTNRKVDKIMNPEDQDRSLKETNWLYAHDKQKYYFIQGLTHPWNYLLQKKLCQVG